MPGLGQETYKVNLRSLYQKTGMLSKTKGTMYKRTQKFILKDYNWPKMRQLNNKNSLQNALKHTEYIKIHNTKKQTKTKMIYWSF